MRPLLDLLARWGVALWTGAVGCVAFVVARHVFGGLEDRQLAGSLMAPMFRDVDRFGMAAAVLFALAAWGYKARVGLALLAGALAGFNAYVVAPKILARGEGFETWHGVGTAVWGAILLLGLALLAIGTRPRASA